MNSLAGQDTTTSEIPGGWGAGTVTVDEALCGGCAMCALICPADQLVMVGTGKNMKSSVRKGQSNCIGCNDCMAICQTGAIVLAQGYDYGGKWKQLDRGELVAPRPY